MFLLNLQDNDRGYTGSGRLCFETGNVGDEPGEMGENLPVCDLGMVSTLAYLCVLVSIVFNKLSCWCTAAQQNAKAKFISSSCAILNSTSGLKCWGSENSHGQLGQGDKLQRGSSPVTMGEFLPEISLAFVSLTPVPSF
jgi:hypothetical protein